MSRRTTMNIHFSSAHSNWSTPQDLFDKLHNIHNFTLDVCASSDNYKCQNYFSITEDGLIMDWATEGSVWMNPPYGREISKWMAKAYEESLKGQKIVCLVPTRTDTAWWHNYAMKGNIEFLRGRLKFGGHKNSAPFPSAIIIFDGL